MKKHEYLEGAVEHAVHAGHEADELQRRRRNAKSESERERQRGERERGRERERERERERKQIRERAVPSPSLAAPTFRIPAYHSLCSNLRKASTKPFSATGSAYA